MTTIVPLSNDDKNCFSVSLSLLLHLFFALDPGHEGGENESERERENGGQVKAIQKWRERERERR